jgi:hypothetical protein
MKTLLISSVVLAVIAGQAGASTFPEKAESRVPSMTKSYVADVVGNLPLKKQDQIRRSAAGMSFGGSEALWIGQETSTTKPIFSPNR